MNYGNKMRMTGKGKGCDVKEKTIAFQNTKVYNETATE